jgi:DNA-binding NtrC family response regulator
MSSVPSTVARLPASHEGAAASPTARPLRVLLVEDSEDDALLLLRHLGRAGFALEIHRVETAEAMRSALAEPWDCVLADYTLPHFSAPEALRLLQQTGRDIPFIMMSGAVSEATAVEAMRAGAHDYV